MSLFRVLACLFAAVPASKIAVASARPSIQTIPLIIEKNQGQAPAYARYLTRRGPTGIYFTSNGVEFLHAGPDGSASRVTWQLVNGAGHVEPQGCKPLPSHSNYFMGSDSGSWVADVENDGEVVYPRVYSGIDLVFHPTGSDLEHDFRVSPGADASRIVFRLSGAGHPVLSSEGDLEFSFGPDKVVLHRPVAYQETPHGRDPVQAEFEVGADDQIRFRLGVYDRSRLLVIDPVFGFSTYLASTGGDSPKAVTTDAEGNIYVTGYTYTGFPLKSPIESGFPAGAQEAMFVTSLNPAGTALRFSTYLGGGFQAGGGAIAIDKKGNIVVAGLAGTSFPHAGILPALSCGFTGTCYVMASIAKSGSKLNYAGEAGGSAGTTVDRDYGNMGRLAVDDDGNAYLAGVTDDSSFPVTPGTLTSSAPGYPYDSTFVMKVDPMGKLLYATIIPGIETPDASTDNNVFFPSGIVVDAKGQVTLAGTANLGLPTTPGVLAYTFPNDGNAENATAGFVLQLNATASKINFASYLPGTYGVSGFTQDKAGNNWFAGGASGQSLPVSATSYQKSELENSYGDCTSGFVMKVNGDATKVLAATYLQGEVFGGECGSSMEGIAVDSKSNVYVGGYSGSPDFPLLNPFVSTMQTGGTDYGMVLAGLNSELSELTFGSFLNAPDFGYGFNGSNFGALTVDASDNLIVVGSTNATDFPTTPGSFQPKVPVGKSGQPSAGFVAKLNMSTPGPSACLVSASIDLGAVPAGTSQSASVGLMNCGNAPLHVKSIVSSSRLFTVKDACPVVDSGATCPVTVTYNAPSNGSSTSATLTIFDDAPVGPQVVQLMGGGAPPMLTATPWTATFGHAEVGTSIAGVVVQISGANEPVDITGASVIGDFAIVSNGCLGWLAAGYTGGSSISCPIALVFSPKAEGQRAGLLTVTANSGIQLVVSLLGVGDAAYQAPRIASVSPAAVQTGGQPQTITVNGWNFYPASSITLAGKALPTTFVNPGQLTAILAPSVLSAIGDTSVSVVNPAPGGASSDPVSISVYRVIKVDAAAIATSADGGAIFAAIPSTARSSANTIAIISAASEKVTSSLPVGKDPALLSASRDGKYLYVANNGGQTIQRINLTTKKVERTFKFPPSAPCNSCNSLAAADILAVPGASEEVVVAFPSQVALYDDKGLVNVAPQSATFTTPSRLSSLAFAGNPSILYALQSGALFSFAVAPSGITYNKLLSAIPWGQNTYATQIVSDGTLLYTNSGQVIDPVKRSLSVFPFSVFAQSGNHTLVSDPTTQSLYGIAFRVDNGYAYSGVEGLRWKNLQDRGFLAFPGEYENQMNNVIRWGKDGLAFLANIGDPQYQQIFLLEGSPFASSGPNAKPVIASVYPSSVPMGSSQTSLVVTGSGIQPDTVIKWNGAALNTSLAQPASEWLSSGAMQVLIPSTNLAKSGRFNLTLTNPEPGGGTSSAFSFTVSAPQPELALSTTSIAFPATTGGTSSAGQTILLANSEPYVNNAPWLTFSSIAIQGTGAAAFSIQNSTCQYGLASVESCTLQVVFSPPGAGSYSASILLESNAAGSPQTISLSGQGK